MAGGERRLIQTLQVIPHPFAEGGHDVRNTREARDSSPPFDFPTLLFPAREHSQHLRRERERESEKRKSKRSERRSLAPDGGLHRIRHAIQVQVQRHAVVNFLPFCRGSDSRNEFVHNFIQAFFPSFYRRKMNKLPIIVMDAMR